MPREAKSLPEMERILTTLAQRENRWRVYSRLAERAQVDLGPAEVWLLSRIGEGAVLHLDEPQYAGARSSLRYRGLLLDGRLNGEGERTYTRIVDARRQGLTELLEGWDPDEHAELRQLLDSFSHELVSEIPAQTGARER
jgi:hypothetical protein